MNELTRLIHRFHEACTAAGIGYAFIGGIAVMAWGEPRATRHVDTIVASDAKALRRLADRLQERGLIVDARDLQDALEDGAHVTVHDPESLFHVDIKLAADAAERNEIEDAVAVPWHDIAIRIVSPEDTLAFKLAFGSEQDLRDARSIVWRMGDRLDQDRLLRAAVRAGVADRLEAFWDETRRMAEDAESGRP